MRNRAKIFLTTLFVALFAMSGTVNAQMMGQEIPKLPIDPDVRMGQLDNGLTYFIRHNQQPKNRANFYIAQRVGSMQEEDNQAGLAHFLEHMAFNGSENFEGKEMIHYLESIGVKFGAELNAYTAFDETMYTIMDAPVDKEGVVDNCLLILRDWSDGITLDEDEIDNERGVIENEWRQGNSGTQRAFTELLARLFPGLNYGKRMPIGSMDVIRNFTYQELRDYYHKWYRPDLQGIIVVGDIDVDEVEAKIKDLFGDIPLDEDRAERVYEEIPNREEPVSIIVTDPEMEVSQYFINYTFDALPMELKGTVMDITMDYMNMALDKMMTARFSELMEQPGTPFAYVGFNTGNFFGLTMTEDAATFVFVPHEGHYQEAMDATVAEIKRARDFGFTPAEYERAKLEIISEYEALVESKANRTNTQYAREYGAYFTQGGYIPGIEMESMIMQQLSEAINVDAINQVFNEQLNSQNLVLFILGAEKHRPNMPTEEGLLEDYYTAMEQEVEPYEDEFADVDLIADEDMPEAGEILSIERDLKYGVTRLALSNGAKVYLLPTDHKKNDIRLKAFSPGGWNYSDLNEIDARAIELATVGGLGEFSNTNLKKVLAGKLVSCNTSVGQFRESITASSTNKDIETMFQLVYLSMTDRRRDDDLFASAIKSEKLTYEMQRGEPLGRFLGDELPAMMYPDNTLQRALTPEEYDQVSYDNILRVYQERFVDASDFTFFLVGSFDVDEVTPLIEKYIGGLPSTYSAEVDEAIEKGSYMAKEDNTRHYFYESDNLSSIIADMYVYDGEYNAETVLTMELLSNILSQQFFKSIREDEGGTYGVAVQGSVNYFLNGETFLLIFFQTDPESTDKLNGKIKSELRQIADGEIDVSEYYNKTVLNLRKAYEENQTENSYWMNVIADEFYWDANQHDGYLELLDSITLQDVCDFLGEMMDNGSYLELIGMTKQTAAEGHAAAGIK